ncbi:hypothetical protein DA097_07520 [Vibrio rotiferianus]|nr:hypothetical protein DA097_07520 [Vibrio rotiferianus]
MLVISTALSTSHVGSLHSKVSSLYKYPTVRCKSQIERSTDPKRFMRTRWSAFFVSKTRPLFLHLERCALTIGFSSYHQGR